MKIVVEVGTPEQQQFIAQDLAFLVAFTGNDGPFVGLDRIILPANFEATVNQLEGRQTYRATRGVGQNTVTALAKMLSLGDEFTIVLSPALYSPSHDPTTRAFVLLHELHHIVNRKKFSEIPSESFTRWTYLGNLHALYDEYSSDRFAFELVDRLFTASSEIWDQYVQIEVDGFTSLLLDSTYYRKVTSELEVLRKRTISVNEYLDRIKPCFDEIALSTTHAFSLIHHSPDVFKQESLIGSKFVNSKTIALMEYFKDKYQKHDMNFDDGVELISDYMTNFGFRFEDRATGPYCHFLDI